MYSYNGPVFGSYRRTEAEVRKLIPIAYSAGIRRFDTAFLYRNDNTVAEMLREYPDAHLTTKIWYQHIRNADRDNRSIVNSIVPGARTVLLHVPEKNFEIAWEQLRAVEEKYIIGVSNFNVEQIERLSSKPTVNQIEHNLFNWCDETVAYCHQQGIVVECHSVLAKAELLDAEPLVRAAKAYQMTPAQCMIAFTVQNHCVPVFSSGDPSHIAEIATVPRRRVEIDVWCNLRYRTHPKYVVN